MQTVCVRIKNYSSKTPSNVKSEFLTTWANAITAVFSGPVPFPILIQIPIQIPPPPPRDGHSFVLLSSTDDQGELLSRLEKAFPLVSWH